MAVIRPTCPISFTLLLLYVLKTPSLRRMMLADGIARKLTLQRRLGANAAFDACP